MIQSSSKALNMANKDPSFYLKLSTSDAKSLKLQQVVGDFDFQYELLDKVVSWAKDNKENLFALASPRNGTYKTYYLKESLEDLDELASHWDCKPTRALFSSIIQYIKAHNSPKPELFCSES